MDDFDFFCFEEPDESEFDDFDWMDPEFACEMYERSQFTSQLEALT